MRQFSSRWVEIGADFSLVLGFLARSQQLGASSFLLSKTVQRTAFSLWSELPTLPFVRHYVKQKTGFRLTKIGGSPDFKAQGERSLAAFLPRGWSRLVADLNYPAFQKVSMEPCIFVVSGKDSKSDVRVVRARSKEAFLSGNPIAVKRSSWAGKGNRIALAASAGVTRVIDKIRMNSIPIESRFDVRTGLQAYERGKGHPPQTRNDVREHVFDRDKREDKNSIRYLEGHDIARYFLSWSGMWMQYGSWLAQPREIGLFTRPRVLLREITAPLPYCLYSTFASEPYLNNKSILNILHPEDSESDLKVLACIINSRLLSVFYKNHAVKGARTIFPKVVIKNLREFPFPKLISQKTAADLAALSDEESALRALLAAAKTPQEKTSLGRQISATDAQIDRLVYNLYGLMLEEIEIVEASAPAK